MRHFYYITDENGEVVFRNQNFACFQELLQPTRFIKPAFNEDFPTPCTNSDILNFLQSFLSGKKLHIIIDPVISREEAEFYANGLKTIFGNYQIEDFTKDPSKIWKHTFASNQDTRISSAKLMVTIKIEDFKNLNQFKYGIYFLRPFNEHYLIFNKFLKYPGGLDFFQWIRVVYSENSVGHNYFRLNVMRFNGQWVENSVQEEVFGENFDVQPFHSLAFQGITVKKIAPFSATDSILEKTKEVYERVQLLKQKVVAQPVKEVIKKPKKTRKNKIILQNHE